MQSMFSTRDQKLHYLVNMLNSIDPRGIKGIDKKAIKDENEVLI
tara:strand:+ start:1292 stop:1423 length:132 start_codon:yes stop_codon:yes gene_type:complete